MPWYECIVNEVGPASDGSETPPPVIYINLTDVAGDFANTWFYAANGIQNQVLDVGITAINGRKNVQVGATAPNPGNSPYTEISRIYELRLEPPLAPTEFHLIWLARSNPGLYVAEIGWKDNSNNEDSFQVRWGGTSRDGTYSAGTEDVPPNSVTALLTLPHDSLIGLYVVAVNSAGEAASNSIVVPVPSNPP